MQVPFKLLTDKDGPSARLRVDVAQTGFFAGRECRSFIRLNIAASSSLVVRVVSPIDFIVFILLGDDSNNVDHQAPIG